ncbi:hypothetical protein [Pantoea sp. 9140]|uniref:hypothetical protein n=1 Tax=Pantoea sp. 9140 TaxID=1500896 RepID=UPI0006896C02|nr:hypothetical protein [Pantoea sp. 9140]
MSEVNRIGAVWNDICESLQLRESSDGELVKYEDYAELKAQRDALAAENAALKHTANIIRALNANPEAARFCGFEDEQIDNAVEAMSTPATDAYLNSVRAEGVDYVAEAIGAKCAELKVGSKDWKALKSIVFTLGDFAAQLRAGKDGE